MCIYLKTCAARFQFRSALKRLFVEDSRPNKNKVMSSDVMRSVAELKALIVVDVKRRINELTASAQRWLVRRCCTVYSVWWWCLCNVDYATSAPWNVWWLMIPVPVVYEWRHQLVVMLSPVGLPVIINDYLWLLRLQQHVVVEVVIISICCYCCRLQDFIHTCTPCPEKKRPEFFSA